MSMEVRTWAVDRTILPNDTGHFLHPFDVVCYHVYMEQEVPNQPSIEGETTDEVIAYVAAHDCQVSRRQIAEWHRVGLLPTPSTEYGGQAGSTSVYPYGTGQRVVAIFELKKTRRSNDDIGWGLWWDGYAMPEYFVRKPL